MFINSILQSFLLVKSENNSKVNLQKIANKNKNDEIVLKDVKPATNFEVILQQNKILCLKSKLIKLN